MRDALVKNDPNEAYHQLYSIADPEFTSFTPWDELEEGASSGSRTGSAGAGSVGEGGQQIIAPLFSLDFEDNTVTFQLTEEQMKDGFHAGNAKIDLSGIR